MEPSTSGSGSSVTLGAGGRSIRQSLRTKKAKVSFSPTLNNAASSSSSQTGGTGTRSGQGQQAEKNGPTKVNNNQTASAIGGLLGHASPNKTQTLRDLLASTQFSMKPRKRSNKRKSIAAQIAQTKEGCIDMTPDSILVNTNLKALLNYDTFNMLPAAYRYKLITLLPECDKLPDTENSLSISPTALNNEFFAKAQQEWRERLSEGEFTPENMQRLKQEEEKEQTKLDPWKAKHFETFWGQRILKDVPKATGPSPIKPVNSVPAAKKNTAHKRSMLVSSMLRHKSLSKAVAASVESVMPAGSHSITNSNSTASSAQVGLLTTVSTTVTATVTSTTANAAASTTKVDKAEVSPTPAKKQRLSPSQRQAQAKTLAQIKAQTEAARSQKSQSAEPVSPLRTALTNTPPEVVDVSCAKSVQTGSVVTTPGIIKVAGQTRTLAQIKARTQAAKAQTTVSIISPPQTRSSTNVSQNSSVRSLLTSPSPPVGRVPAQAQTRTLAQIKAQTRARAQQAAATVVPTTTEQRPAPSLSPALSKNHPNILLTSTGRPKTPSKTATPVKTEPNNGINLQRSLAICQAEYEKSIVKVNSPGPATGPQQSQMSASKLLFSQSGSQSDQSVPSDGEASRSTASPAASLTSGTASPTRVLTVPSVTSAGNTEGKQILIVTSNNSLDPNTVLVVSAPSSTVVTCAGANSTRTLTNSVQASSATTGKVYTSGTSSGVRCVLTHENLRAMLASSTPPRASSAPPTQNKPEVVTIVRSASVGGDASNQTGSNQGEVSLNLSSEEVNFLSKAGTPTQAGREGSPRYVVRPASIVGKGNSKPNPQSVVSGSFSVQTVALRSNQTTTASSAQPVTSSIVSNSVETQVANLLANPKVSIMATTSAIPNVQMITAASNMTTVMLQPLTSTAVGTTVTATSVSEGTPTINPSSCACSLKAMVMCKKCGAFCHDDCIGPSRLCVTCLITT
ncbi:polycomb group protein Asx-like [Haliotis cracherodii]|uniref:polycomb group protein Asx-like n=1 Tax=Haliotis cracherodii TaxID=6455 RepID=UPI0039E85945